MDVFCEIPCLTEHSIPLKGVVLQKKWFKLADKRIIGQYLQKFITYNSELFQFLGVEPIIVGADQNSSLLFRSSNFIGTIPLRSPDTGKQIGDFVVVPRFSSKNKYEEYIEILNLLGKNISPDVVESLPLVSGRNFRPPMYLEAIKYITTLEKLVQKPWNKFKSEEKIKGAPAGQVNWRSYVDREYKVENRLKFPVRKNVMSELHGEYAALRYVFDVCKKELLSTNTPQRIKNESYKRLSFLEEQLYYHKPQKVDAIKVQFSDSLIVKECKEQANKILHFDFVDSTAWRVDFSDVFEKFIQHIFESVAREMGGSLRTNMKFKARNRKQFSWELKHVEPDAVLQKEELFVFIDAKYKANLYNKYNSSETLKEEHRRDLHQILAYTSFDKTSSKFGFLCYPANEVELNSIKYANSLNATETTIFILGVPLKKDKIDEAKRLIVSKLNNL